MKYNTKFVLFDVFLKMFPQMDSPAPKPTPLLEPALADHNSDKQIVYSAVVFTQQTIYIAVVSAYHVGMEESIFHIEQIYI